MLPFCSTVLQNLEAGRAMGYVCIIAQFGSAPRVSGARMLVFEDGSIWGTVGGGRAEGEAIRHTVVMVRQQDGPQAKVAKYSLRNVNDMDMVCGGDLTMLMRRLAPEADQIELFRQAAEAEKKGNPFLLISTLNFSPRDLEHALFSPQDVPPSGAAPLALALLDGSRNVAEATATDFHITAAQANFPALADGELEELLSVLPKNDTPYMYKASNGTLVLLERFFRRQKLIIFGAGHVALSLAHLAVRLDFDTIVIDDRAEFANEQRFPGCQIIVPPSMNESDSGQCLNALNPREQDAIVIMTRGHACDRESLAASLPTRAGYIGMIGSRPKRAHVYGLLRKAGFAASELEKVHCPIGLDIGADTPEEIAVSIAGEIIDCLRATHRKS